jgi:hypothetical protein
MNWKSDRPPLEAGPMTDEELQKRYPALFDETVTNGDPDPDWSEDVRNGELVADESRQPVEPKRFKPDPTRPGYEYVSLDQILDAHLGTNRSAALQPGVKKVSDVIKELLTIMSEVGDVEVKPFRAAVLERVEVTYDPNDDTVRISG